MSKSRFTVKFAPAAAKEYEKMDNSIVGIIDNAIDKLEERADEIGKTLSNYKNTKLAGCKELKLRDIGIRIIFKIIDQNVNILQVVYILAIDSRSKDQVFKIAHERYQSFKNDSSGRNEEGKPRTKKGK